MVEMVVSFCTLIAISSSGSFEESCKQLRLKYASELQGAAAKMQCVIGGGLVQINALNQQAYKFEKDYLKAVVNKWKSNNPRIRVLAEKNKIHRFKPGYCDLKTNEKIKNRSTRA